MNEYMTKDFRDESPVFITCYHIDEDVENEDNIDKLASRQLAGSTMDAQASRATGLVLSRVSDAF